MLGEEGRVCLSSLILSLWQRVCPMIRLVGCNSLSNLDLVLADSPVFDCAAGAASPFLRGLRGSVLRGQTWARRPGSVTAVKGLISSGVFNVAQVIPTRGTYRPEGSYPSCKLLFDLGSLLVHLEVLRKLWRTL